MVSRFEHVRVNYERIRENKPIDKDFEIRGTETIALTNILRDLRAHRPLLTDKYYELMIQVGLVVSHFANIGPGPLSASGPGPLSASQRKKN